jgi:glycosyltransferase involved in cell wall biosynthesis
MTATISEPSAGTPVRGPAGPPISFLVPAYNEEGGIVETVERLQRLVRDLLPTSCEIIVIDDGSHDRTGELAEQLGVRVIRHPANGGYGRALKTGIVHARHDWCAIVDADGTYPIERFPELLRHVPAFDMAVGARTGVHYRGSPRKRFGRWVLLHLVAYVVGQRIPDVNSGMRVFNKAVALDHLHRISSGYSFTTTTTLAFLLSGYFVKYVPIEYHARQGTSKVSMIRDTLRMLQILTRAVMRYNPVKLFLPLCGASALLGSGLALLAAVLPADVHVALLILALASQGALILGALGLLADTK